MDYLFQLHGRLNRARYWLAVLIYLVAMLVSVALGFALGIVGMAISIIVYIAVVVSSILIGRLRLHDRDKSAWWLVVFYLGPTILSTAGQGFRSEGSPMLAIILNLCAFAVSIWALVELGFLRGTAGPNRFGPDPLAAQAPIAAAP
jgi:uncharacterized membrane protein YhaH (DUF805 family)